MVLVYLGAARAAKTQISLNWISGMVYCLRMNDTSTAEGDIFRSSVCPTKPSHPSGAPSIALTWCYMSFSFQNGIGRVGAE